MHSILGLWVHRSQVDNQGYPSCGQSLGAVKAGTQGNHGKCCLLVFPLQFAYGRAVLSWCSYVAQGHLPREWCHPEWAGDLDNPPYTYLFPSRMTLGCTRLTKLGMLVPLGEGSHEPGSPREGIRVGRQLKEVGLHHSGVTWKCQDRREE